MREFVMRIEKTPARCRRYRGLAKKKGAAISRAFLTFLFSINAGLRGRRLRATEVKRNQIGARTIVGCGLGAQRCCART
jgi:hypothetical protein